jgi:hypothetical protein
MDKSRNPVILNVIYHRQNPLDSTYIESIEAEDVAIAPEIRDYIKFLLLVNDHVKMKYQGRVISPVHSLFIPFLCIRYKSIFVFRYFS